MSDSETNANGSILTEALIFKHRYLHALAKSASAERIELLSLSGRVRNLTAELSASNFLYAIAHLKTRKGTS